MYLMGMICAIAGGGRLVVVGFISDYGKNQENVHQSRIYSKLFWKAASVRGFLMPCYAEHIPAARDRLLDLFYAGNIKVAVDFLLMEGWLIPIS